MTYFDMHGPSGICRLPKGDDGVSRLHPLLLIVGDAEGKLLKQKQSRQRPITDSPPRRRGRVVGPKKRTWMIGSGR